ncbi:MAG: hypothetical protein M3388_18490 [Acidobacteriota bacterium]|nr:hypothetical protein [Acidobacteriota bacterium]
MQKIQNVIEVDKSLRVGLFYEFQNTTRKNNKCSRTYRAVVEIRVVVDS